jgi:hypothetical protein
LKDVLEKSAGVWGEVAGAESLLEVVAHERVLARVGAEGPEGGAKHDLAPQIDGSIGVVQVWHG